MKQPARDGVVDGRMSLVTADRQEIKVTGFPEREKWIKELRLNGGVIHGCQAPPNGQTDKRTKR